MFETFVICQMLKVARRKKKLADRNAGSTDGKIQRILPNSTHLEFQRFESDKILEKHSLK
jgi:hypothetical protein